MVIAALVSFAILLVAWLLAPADASTAVLSIAPEVEPSESVRLAEVA